MTQLGQQIHEPVAVARRFQTHTHRPRQPFIELPGFSAGVHQLPFLGFSRFRV